jgi:hypothetical protein
MRGEGPLRQRNRVNAGDLELGDQVRGVSLGFELRLWPNVEREKKSYRVDGIYQVPSARKLVAAT